MTKKETKDLETVLRRVPTVFLEDELKRRQSVPASHQARYEVTLEQVAAEHNVREADVLGASCRPQFVAARFALYRSLHDQGMSYMEIAGLTGHHRNRIAQALNKRKKI